MDIKERYDRMDLATHVVFPDDKTIHVVDHIEVIEDFILIETDTGFSDLDRLLREHPHPRTCNRCWLLSCRYYPPIDHDNLRHRGEIAIQRRWHAKSAKWPAWAT